MQKDTQALLRQIREQDSESAFRVLFDMHYERLFRIAYFYLQNDDWAKEIALDVLADLWTKRKTMIIPDDFRHYSFVMVKNAAINLWNREHRMEKVSIDELSTTTTVSTQSTTSTHSTISTPTTPPLDTELFETYERLLSELPARCREVFCRIKEDDQSYAEVAEAMGISAKTVDAQLQKALKYLRNGLNHYLGHESGKRFFMLFL